MPSALTVPGRRTGTCGSRPVGSCPHLACRSCGRGDPWTFVWGDLEMCSSMGSASAQDFARCGVKVRPDTICALLAVLALSTALLPGFALADGFTIVDGQVAGQQVMTDNGDVGTIEAGGRAQASGTSTIILAANQQRFSNYGDIVSYGEYGIRQFGEDSEILNAGTISAFFGIYSAGVASITNTGTINAPAGNGYGIILLKGGYINNSGSIIAPEWGTVGIYTSGKSDIINSGYIKGGQFLGSAILAIGNETNVWNTGRIDIGYISYGITVSGDNVTVHNSGYISAENLGLAGILTEGNGAAISNSGYIEAETGLRGCLGTAFFGFSRRLGCDSP
jgi:hypothetical protein